MYEKYAKRRDELGMTDYRVSQISGVLTSTLSEWKKHYETGGESGYQPKVDKLSSIAKALDMKVTDFLE
jgi:transcriptional regulator with XRE-family HTH domain